MTSHDWHGRLIQSLWIGDRLSRMEQLSIKSFIANGYDFHLYTYGPMEGIPDGTILHDAREILPLASVFRDAEIDSFSGFADLFRYKLLLERGGWWVDMDMVCLRELPQPKEYAFVQETHQVMGNCVLFSKPDSPAFRYLYEVARTKNPAHLKWCEIGPPLVDEAVRTFNLQQYVLPPSAFCPIPGSQWYNTFIPGRIPTLDEGVFCIHFWHENWRRAGLNKDESYGPRSLFEVLKLRYHVL